MRKLLSIREQNQQKEQAHSTSEVEYVHGRSHYAIVKSELQSLQKPKDAIAGVVIDIPNPEEAYYFEAKITPPDGLWKDATYRFTFEVPNQFPYAAPRVRCETLILHPNIDFQGEVDLNILRGSFTPTLTIKDYLFGLMMLLLEPNPLDPQNREVADLMIKNEEEFKVLLAKSLRGETVLGREFPKLL